MYINGKMTSVETIPGMGEEGIMEGVNSTMIYLLYCKNFCKCHNVFPVQQLKKKLIYMCIYIYIYIYIYELRTLMSGSFKNCLTYSCIDS
jgi:hypothetical protein